jgi:hypothetical protein
MGTSLWILVFGGCQIFLSLVGDCRFCGTAQLLHGRHLAMAQQQHPYKGCLAATAWLLQLAPHMNCCMLTNMQLRNFNSLRGISCMAAVMALGYSTIATGEVTEDFACPSDWTWCSQQSFLSSILSMKRHQPHSSQMRAR